MTTKPDRARVRSRQDDAMPMPQFVVRPGEAGTSVTTVATASLDGPHTDHLAQLIRRQRRRRWLRQGLLSRAAWLRPRASQPRPTHSIGEVAPDLWWAWLTDGDTRRLLAVRDQNPADGREADVVDLRETCSVDAGS